MPGILSFASVLSQALGQQFQKLKLGAGGLISDVSISTSGGADATDTIVIRTDSYNGYLWNPNATSPVGNAGAIPGAWHELMTAASMPAAFTNMASGYGAGTPMLAVAPSDANTMYAVWREAFPDPLTNSVIYKTTNKGANWARAGSFSINSNDANANAGAPIRFNGQRMQVHPTNSSVCFVGFQADGGLWCTLDGGATWNQISGTGWVNPGSGSEGVWGLQFNPSTPNTLYAFSDGNGVYQTTNANLGASATWTKINSGSGPSAVYMADITPNGIYYVCDSWGNGNIWSYNGTWTEQITGNIYGGVNCDPSDATGVHVVAVTGDGRLNEHTSGGWSGLTQFPTVAWNDIPWQGANAVGLNPISTGYSKANSNVLYLHGELDFFKCTFPSGSVTTSTTPNWISMGVGEEQIVGNCIICGVSGKPVFAGWDFSLFQPPLTSYPLVGGISLTGGTQLNTMWSLDYAKNNSSFIVGIGGGSQYPAGFASQQSFYSSNSCASCTLLQNTHDGVHPCVAPNGWTTTGNPDGGCISVSTASNWIWASNGTGGSTGEQPFYTLNGGIDWTAVTLPGVSSYSGFQSSVPNTLNRQVSADEVTTGTFYLYFNGVGFFTTTNGGATWTKNSTSPPGGITSIFAVPGHAGHLWAYAGGGAGLPEHFNPLTESQVYYTPDAGTTWVQVNTIGFVSGGIGFGAAATGQSYPAVYAQGWNTQTSSSNVTIGSAGNYTFNVGAGLSGTYGSGTSLAGVPVNVQQNTFGSPFPAAIGTIASYDNVSGNLVCNLTEIVTTGNTSSWVVSTWGLWQNTGGESATPIWNQIAGSTGWPFNSFDMVSSICGDPSIFGQVYIAQAGSGGLVRM